MSPRSWRLRGQDILDAIHRAQRILSGVTLEEFKKDEARVLAAMMCVSIVGEAANKIPESVRQKYPDVAWPEIRGMRNLVSHEYFRVDEAILFDTCQEHFPILKKQIERMLDKDDV